MDAGVVFLPHMALAETRPSTVAFNMATNAALRKSVMLQFKNQFLTVDKLNKKQSLEYRTLYRIRADRNRSLHEFLSREKERINLEFKDHESRQKETRQVMSIYRQKQRILDGKVCVALPARNKSASTRDCRAMAEQKPVRSNSNSQTQQPAGDSFSGSELKNQSDIGESDVTNREQNENVSLPNASIVSKKSVDHELMLLEDKLHVNDGPHSDATINKSGEKSVCVPEPSRRSSISLQRSKVIVASKSGATFSESVYQKNNEELKEANNDNLSGFQQTYANTFNRSSLPERSSYSSEERISNSYRLSPKKRLTFADIRLQRSLHQNFSLSLICRQHDQLLATPGFKDELNKVFTVYERKAEGQLVGSTFIPSRRDFSVSTRSEELHRAKQLTAEKKQLLEREADIKRFCAKLDALTALRRLGLHASRLADRKPPRTKESSVLTNKQNNEKSIFQGARRRMSDHPVLAVVMDQRPPSSLHPDSNDALSYCRYVRRYKNEKDSFSSQPTINSREQSPVFKSN